MIISIKKKNNKRDGHLFNGILETRGGQYSVMKHRFSKINGRVCKGRTKIVSF